MKTILTILSFLFSSILFAQDVPEKYQKLWQTVNESEPEAAKKEALKELKKNPKDPWLNWIAGHACNPVLENEEAKAYFEKTIALDSTIGAAYYALAGKLDDSTDMEQIIVLYSKAIKFDPQNGFSYVYRGFLYLKKGLTGLAMADAESAKKCETIDPLLVDGLIIEILNAEGKTKELRSFVNNGGFADSEPLMWSQSTRYIAIRVYEELEQQQNVCKLCRMIQEEYAIFDDNPPALILEKLKNCK